MVVQKLVGAGVAIASSLAYLAIVSDRSALMERNRILIYPLWYENLTGARRFENYKKTTTIINDHHMSKSLHESFLQIKTTGISNLLIEEEKRSGKRGKEKLQKISKNIIKGDLVIVHDDALRKNACGFTSGHVVVEERILKNLSEEESRAILCHEYAHSILRHLNEKKFIKITCRLLKILIVIKGVIRVGSPKYWETVALHFVASKVWESIYLETLIHPHSRMIELETDKVGLMLHRACGWQDKFFVEAIHKFYEDESSEEKTGMINRFLKWRLERASTHPTSKLRIQMIEDFVNSSSLNSFSQVDLEEPAQEIDEDHPTDPGIHESGPPSCDSISLSLFSQDNFEEVAVPIPTFPSHQESRWADSTTETGQPWAGLPSCNSSSNLFSQEHGGDLNEAVNSHFSEGDRSITRHPTSIPASQNDLMDIDDEAVEVEPQRSTFPLLSAAQQLNPFSLFDPNFCRSFLEGHSAAEFASEAPWVTHPREVRQIPIEFKDEHTSGPSPAIEDVTGTAHANFPEAHGTVIVDDEDDEGIPTVPSAPRLDRVADYGNDIEEEMIRAATEASRREVVKGFPNQHIGDITDSSGPSLQQTHSQIEDPELSRAVSLSLKISKHKRGIRNGPKALKPIPVIVRCKCCGRVKLPHFFCCSGDRTVGEHNNSTNS